MNEASISVSTTIELPADPSPVAPSFARDEGGQISVLVVLSLVPFVLLLAFIFNSGSQTIRKIEMQGAADAAAVTSAVTVARGMNIMVLNNNAMAEVLSLMIVVRSIRNLTRIMQVYVPLKTIAVCAACLGLCSLCHKLIESIPKWFSANSMWSSIDRAINNESGGLGWRILDILDRFNQVVKSAFPFWAAYQARDYAHKNGADLDPIYGFVLAGKSEPSLTIAGVSFSLPIPTFPVARGPEQAIAFRADEEQYRLGGILNIVSTAYVITIDALNAIEAIVLLQALRWANLSYLKDDFGAIGDIFNRLMRMLPGGFGRFLGRMTRILGRFLGIELLSWRANPPKPMLLTDHPGQSETDDREIDDNTRRNVLQYLRHLGVALGRVPPGGRIGGRFFNNTPNSLTQVQFTYAQAEVYNPKQFDMWTQDWRAQLTRAKLFDEKVNDILQVLSLRGDLNWSFVNTH
jgi:hypothetical protein